MFIKEFFSNKNYFIKFKLIYQDFWNTIFLTPKIIKHSGLVVKKKLDHSKTKKFFIETYCIYRLSLPIGDICQNK